MALTDEEKRKIARVIWAYTGKTQAVLEAELGWNKDRLRSMLAKGKHSPPTTDELLEMAAAAGVPPALVIDGWVASDPVARMQAEISRLSVGLAEATAELAQHRQTLQELRGRGRRPGA